MYKHKTRQSLIFLPTGQWNLTTLWVSILVRVGMHQTLGKGPLHARKETRGWQVTIQRKRNTWTLFSIYYVCLFFLLLFCFLFRVSLVQSGRVGKWHLGHLLLHLTPHTNRVAFPLASENSKLPPLCPSEHSDALLTTLTSGIGTI